MNASDETRGEWIADVEPESFRQPHDRRPWTWRRIASLPASWAWVVLFPFVIWEHVADDESTPWSLLALLGAPLALAGIFVIIGRRRRAEPPALPPTLAYHLYTEGLGAETAADALFTRWRDYDSVNIGDQFLVARAGRAATAVYVGGLTADEHGAATRAIRLAQRPAARRRGLRLALLWIALVIGFYTLFEWLRS